MTTPATMTRYGPVAEALQRRAAETPGGLAFDADGVALTYGELYKEAVRASRRLAGAGLRPGDRLAVLLPTGPEFLYTFFGGLLAGAAPVAVNHHLPAATARRRIELVRARVAAIDAAMAEALRETMADSATILIAPEELAQTPEADPAEFTFDPESPAYLQITSGTTGEPKAAMISHRAVQSYLDTAPDSTGIRPSDVLVSWLPLYHDLGLVYFVFMPVYRGRPCHLIPPSIRNLRRWLETIDRVRGTMTGGPDFAYRIAARVVSPKGLDLSCLESATNGGEPPRKATIEMFEARFGLRNVVRPAYGLAEATLGVASVARGEARRYDAKGAVACGKAQTGVEVRIVDDAGGALPPGETGEITVRGGRLFSGYLDDEAATRETLRGDWLYTGDLGKLDEEGHLYILGRRRALIKRGGATIAPREVEEAADGAAGVRFSAAVGVERESAAGSEELIVFAEVRPEGAASEEARAAIAGDIADRIARVLGQAPGEVLLVRPRAIPRTENGKTRYGELRRQYAEGELAAAGAILFGADRAEA